MCIQSHGQTDRPTETMTGDSGKDDIDDHDNVDGMMLPFRE